MKSFCKLIISAGGAILNRDFNPARNGTLGELAIDGVVPIRAGQAKLPAGLHYLYKEIRELKDAGVIQGIRGSWAGTLDAKTLAAQAKIAQKCEVMGKDYIAHPKLVLQLQAAEEMVKSYTWADWHTHLMMEANALHGFCDIHPEVTEITDQCEIVCRGPSDFPTGYLRALAEKYPSLEMTVLFCTGTDGMDTQISAVLNDGDLDVTQHAPSKEFAVLTMHETPKVSH